MSRKQKRMGPVGCFGQIENIKRQSLVYIYNNGIHILYRGEIQHRLPVVTGNRWRNLNQVYSENYCSPSLALISAVTSLLNWVLM